MIIDVVINEDVLLRYESTCIPRVGETISTIIPEKKGFTVLAVDHLVGPRPIGGEMRQELITITARNNQTDAEPCPICRADQKMKYAAKYCFLCGRRTA